MHTANIKLERVQRFWLFWLLMMTAVTLFLTLVVWARASLAQETAQPTYASGEQATQALYDAVQNNNEQTILQILGGRKELTSSGYKLEDNADRKQFANKFQQMHRLVRQTDGSMVLYIGAENWPFPEPLISEKGKWRFDADAGMQEILFRRIGEHEAVAIRVCHALVRASTGDTTGTSDTSSNDPVTRYAQTLVSPQAGGVRRIRANAQGASTSFDGYRFRQVSNDADIADGNVVFVAYPEQYRSSGVMTFIVTSDDVVFEKDLGPETAKLAKGIGKNMPDLSWHVAE